MGKIIRHVLESKNENITSYFTADRAVTVGGRTIYGHNGIDITPAGFVITPQDGVVTYVKDTVPGVDTSGLNDFGNNVKIKVNNKYLLRFCHLKKGIALKVGDKVQAGDVVGYMGNTGFSTGTHLHFGLYDISSGVEVAINPLPYLEGELNIVETKAAATEIAAYEFKPGDKVRVNAGANDYSGHTLNSFVYEAIFDVMEISKNDKNRICIGNGEEITAAMNAITLTLVSAAASAASDSKAPNKVGDKVRVKEGATDYNGAALASFVFDGVYDVLEISKERPDRFCIGVGDKVTAAMRVEDLVRV